RGASILTIGSLWTIAAVMSSGCNRGEDRGEAAAHADKSTAPGGAEELPMKDVDAGHDAEVDDDAALGENGAKSPASNIATAVDWHHGDFESALRKAKAEGKLVF